MHYLEISFEQENSQFEMNFVLGWAEYSNDILEYCGCKPSKWDGCKGAEVFACANKGREELTATLTSHDIENNKYKMDLLDFFNRLIATSYAYPEARVKVRYN